MKFLWLASSVFFFDRPAFRYIPKGVYEFLAVWLYGCLSVRMYLFFLPPSPPPPPHSC